MSLFLLSKVSSMCIFKIDESFLEKERVVRVNPLFWTKSDLNIDSTYSFKSLLTIEDGITYIDNIGVVIVNKKGSTFKIFDIDFGWEADQLLNLFEILNSCCENQLKQIEIKWNNKKSLCIVMCSKGYPDTYTKNIEIKNIDLIDLKPNDFLFHAGTVSKNNVVLSNGGRVLNFVSLSDNFSEARNNIYRIINNLNWPDGFYRKDIGYKVID